MKNILLTLILSASVATCYAMGPNEITLNGTKFVKNSEKSENNKIAAEYYPTNGNASASIVLTYVLDKNDPNNIVKGLKEKKSVSISETENLKPDHSDMMVTFVKFDLPNLKVQNNLCRIIKNPTKGGSLVFQYIETNKLKHQGEGTPVADFAVVSENLKQLPLDQYLTTLSQTMKTSARPTYAQDTSHIPWYKRPNARAGAEYYSKGTVRNTSYRYRQ